MSTIKISKEELEQVLSTINKFPEVTDVTIVTTQTGIGSTLEVLFNTKINNIPGVFKVDLTDVSKW